MTGPRPSMARYEELRRLYEAEGMAKAEAKRLALADATYEAEERESIQKENEWTSKS